jgi:hypothetical protein
MVREAHGEPNHLFNLKYTLATVFVAGIQFNF